MFSLKCGTQGSSQNPWQRAIFSLKCGTQGSSQRAIFSLKLVGWLLAGLSASLGISRPLAVKGDRSKGHLFSRKCGTQGWSQNPLDEMDGMACDGNG